MKKNRIKKGMTSALLVLVVAALVFSAVITPQAEAASYSASFIDRNDDVKLNYKDYLDKNVAYELPDSVSSDATISVIVMLEDVENIYDAYQKTDKSVSFTDYALFSEETAAIEAKVAARKAEILKLLDEQGVEYTVSGIDYTTLLTGFEIYITARDFEKTCSSMGDKVDIMVSEAYAVADSEVVENPLFVTGDTGITDKTGVDFDGSGMVVAVLDTGLDYAHSAFDPSRFTSGNLGLTYEQVAALLSQTMASQQYEGLSVDDVFISNKVPFGFDYADYDPDVYSTHNNHGTHVSGIIVGNDDTILGVAPNAQLVSMKVFSDTYDSALASWILSALEDCVILGVDVINMSLGTAAGFSREGDEEKLWGVYDKIRESGISLIVAASNSYSSAYGSEANGNLGLTSNPDTGTVGSPGTYDGAMSVASIDGTLTPYLLHGDTIIYFTESNDNGGNPLDFCASILGGQETMELEYVVVPGVGRAADYTGLDVQGKIALVRRGSTTFEEKALLAQNAGAIGIIIYNNVAGDIKMNVGDATLASCSISQDAGEALAAAGDGKLTVSVNQAAGPFISDFSSWGPTPDLTIKPEITGYGGNILSAVTGGGYDRLSGTSMACPNLAGISVLMRQYVMQKFPDIANDPVAVNDMVYRLLMSTADITYNKNGLPYAVRKQGSGLANLQNAVGTPAVLLTYDKDGNAMDKVKLELGDDKEKTGIYTMTFTVQNFGDVTLSYNLGAYVMTEGVSETLTNAGNTTVTEQGYLLGAGLTVDSVTGGTIDGTKLTVAAGQDATVTVTIALTDEDKAYMDASFANGMYVEGFITLTAAEGTEIDMSVPYLAFYGDWTQAPIFDKEYYETNADELNDAIDEEDKNKADAYATTAIGGISDDYVSYLGAYYFEQDPANTRVISASKDYIALSNQEGTVHSLRFVWAGLLRNAAKVVITITDDTTGEVVYETVDTDVRKSYGDGGSIYPANIEIEFDTMDYNMMNNSEYTVTLTAFVDYGDGGEETNERNVFTFPLVVDFEAPTVTDAQFYYTYDKTLKKNRLYVDVSVYDNHHAMAMQVGYVNYDMTNAETPLEIVTFSQYMTPIYSVKNGTTVVTYELTDYIYDIKANGYNGSTGRVSGDSFVITVYDYALNYATYEVGLPNDYADFYMDGLSDLTLSPNEVFSLEPLVYPTTEWAELLEFRSNDTSVANVVNNKVVAVTPGTTTVQVRDPSTNKRVSIKVTVLAEGDEGYKRYDKPVADVFRLDGYYTNYAFFQLDSTQRDLGSTGDSRHFDGVYSLAMYPSEKVTVRYTLDAFFPDITSVVFSSSNEKVVSVDATTGTITANEEGFATISVKIYQDGKSTFYSESISIEVKDPFVTMGATLSSYFGNGGLVTIPSDLKVTTIGSFAFSNFDYVLKTEEEYAIDDSSLSKQWYLGENDTITKVIIPEGIKTISSYAFAGLEGLEEVVLPSTLESIEYGAFYGCTSLQKITFSGENNLKIINKSAFELCDLQGTLELPSAYVISDYAFAGNVDLKGIKLPATLQTIGAYAFAGCSSLNNVEIAADKCKFGEYAFSNCTSLTTFTVNSSVIPAGMFYSCSSLTEVNIGKDVKAIYEYAFRDTAITSYNVDAGNAAFKVQSADYILSADGKTLVAVSPTIRGEYSASDIGGANVTAVGRGAFSHNTRITSVDLPGVTVVEAYGFAVESVSSSGKVSSGRLQSLNLGELTYIGEYGFCGVAVDTLPKLASDAQIGKYAFAYAALKTVTIPNGMVIPEAMFYECASLAEVVIGDNVTIGDRAFFVDKNNHFEVIRYKDEKGNNRYYYQFSSPLTKLVIGSNAVIGESAFANAASVESVTLGENAVLGNMAFYNCSSLKDIDLSKVASLGEYALSGDVWNICSDTDMTVAAVSSEGTYIYRYYAPQITSADLSSATEIGAYAFAYCRDMTNVTLGDAITEIPAYAFAGCIALAEIDLTNVITVGDYAFMETGLTRANMPNVQTVGKYAFVICAQLSDVTLSAEGTVIGEGAFAQNDQLLAVTNLDKATEIGAYAFAYSAITNVDLSGAVSIGDFAFMKTELTEFTVVLGDQLTSLGDNPFAMCKVAPFYTVEVETFNGVDYETPIYTYDISASVFVIDGSLYCAVPSGMELITYTGMNADNLLIAEGTVRITGQALAGSEVKMVTLPASLGTIGHKAFYQCEGLKVVNFKSYDAPILEEEFDASYYESLEHLPGTGNHGEYTDYDGNTVQIEGNGQLPYFMWNATGGLYSNVFYGANFVDYVGYVENKLVMVRPTNGQNYDTYILGQYFDLGMVLDGSAAADKNTQAFIDAINALPNPVGLSDEQAVIAARALYNKITNLEQQALAAEAYAKLQSAEQRIAKLKESASEGETETPPVEQPVEQKNNTAVVIVFLALIVIGGVVVFAMNLSEKKKAKAKAKAEASAEEAAAETAEE